MGAGNPYAAPAQYINTIKGAPRPTQNRGKGDVATPGQQRTPTLGGNGKGGASPPTLGTAPALAPNQSVVMGRSEGTVIRESTPNPAYAEWKAAQDAAAANANAQQPQAPQQTRAGQNLEDEQRVRSLYGLPRRRQILDSDQTQKGRKQLLGQ